MGLGSQKKVGFAFRKTLQYYKWPCRELFIGDVNNLQNPKEYIFEK